MNRLRVGDWAPGRSNLALLLVQLILLWGAAIRGIDYLRPRTPAEITATGLSVVESALPIPVWGAAFITCSAVGLLGLAGRWAAPVIVAHFGLWALYVGVGIGELQVTGVDLNSLAIAGITIGGLGTWIVFRGDDTSTWVRLLVGLPAMFAGQWLLAEGLGQDYRRGTVLIATGLIHAVSAAATLVLWLRQRASRRVREERAATTGIL